MKGSCCAAGFLGRGAVRAATAAGLSVRSRVFVWSFHSKDQYIIIIIILLLLL
jgi:hypothetical protein